MGLLDFILNLVGLLLWFNWRAARFDPLSKFTPATLAGTLRRAEKTSFRRWHLPLVRRRFTVLIITKEAAHE